MKKHLENHPFMPPGDIFDDPQEETIWDKLILW